MTLPLLLYHSRPMLRLVRYAKTVEGRRAYLKLAHVWLEAAVAEDLDPPDMPPAPRLRITGAQPSVNLTPISCRDA